MQQTNDTLKRKIKRLFPSDNSADAVIERDPVMTQAAIAALGTTDFKEAEIKDAVGKRGEQLLYTRSAARAAVYVERFPKTRQTTDDEQELLLQFYTQKMEWSGDFSKFARNVRDMRTARCGRLSATFIDPVMKYKHCKEDSFQIEVNERIMNQSWPGVEDAVFPGKFGRGVMSTIPFVAGDVIMDYHGTLVRNVPYETYIKQLRPDGRLPIPEFILVIPHRRSLIDATDEICWQHPTKRCLGRLSNHGAKKTKRKNFCNMKIVDVEFNHLPKVDGKFKRAVLFVARRNIPALEQLRWDYEDKTAQQLLSE